MARAAWSRGWIRVFGWGVSWRPAREGLWFSERYGYATTFRIGSTRFRVLAAIAMNRILDGERGPRSERDPEEGA
jgi:hypothetical protein